MGPAALSILLGFPRAASGRHHVCLVSQMLACGLVIKCRHLLQSTDDQLRQTVRTMLVSLPVDTDVLSPARNAFKPAETLDFLRP